MVGGSTSDGDGEDDGDGRRLERVYVTYDFSCAAMASGGMVVVRSEAKEFIRSSEILCYGDARSDMWFWESGNHRVRVNKSMLQIYLIYDF